MSARSGYWGNRAAICSPQAAKGRPTPDPSREGRGEAGTEVAGAENAGTENASGEEARGNESLPSRGDLEGSLQYQWHSNYQDTFGLTTNSGVRVYGYAVPPDFKNLWEVPNLYLRKFEGETFTDTLHLTITATNEGQQSGFVVMGRDYCRLSVELQDEAFVLKRIICKDADRDGAEESAIIGNIKAHSYNAGAKTNYECHFSVRLQCNKGGLCHFCYSIDGCQFTPVAIPFQAREGKWIGAKYGVFSITHDAKSKGWVDLKFCATPFNE